MIAEAENNLVYRLHNNQITEMKMRIDVVEVMANSMHIRDWTCNCVREPDLIN